MFIFQCKHFAPHTEYIMNLVTYTKSSSPYSPPTSCEFARFFASSSAFFFSRSRINSGGGGGGALPLSKVLPRRSLSKRIPLMKSL